MPRTVICHPFSADVEGHRAAVNGLARTLALEDHFPLAPQIYLPAFVDETRERGLALMPSPPRLVGRSPGLRPADGGYAPRGRRGTPPGYSSRGRQLRRWGGAHRRAAP